MAFAAVAAVVVFVVFVVFVVPSQHSPLKERNEHQQV